MAEKIRRERFLLEVCKKHISKKLRWAPSDEWTHGDYQKLSELIFNQTNVQISHNTLKRIWGKLPFEGTPNTSTRDALARFAGFIDWEDLRQKTPDDDESTPESGSPAAIISNPIYHQPEGITRNSGFDNRTPSVSTPHLDSNAGTSNSGRQPLKGRTYYRKPDFGNQKLNIVLSWIASLFMGGLLLAWALWVFWPNQEPDYSQIKIVASSTVAKAPNTVIFNYDVSNFPDSVFIVFHDDKFKYLDPAAKTVSYVYYMPNYYIARVVTGGKVVKKIPVHCTTEGWEMVGPYSIEPFNYPQFHKIDTSVKGMLHLNPDSTIFPKTGVPQQFWVSYRLVKSFDYSADDIWIEARVRNNPKEGGQPWFESSIMAVGEFNTNLATYAGKGTSGMVDFKLGEQSIPPGNKDLSFLERDMSQWQLLGIRLDGKKAAVMEGDSVVHQVSYQKKFGSLKGVILRFKGCGAVDWVRIKTSAGKELYYKDF